MTTVVFEKLIQKDEVYADFTTDGPEI